jgi:hypothetical protein
MKRNILTTFALLLVLSTTGCVMASRSVSYPGMVEAPGPSEVMLERSFDDAGGFGEEAYAVAPSMDYDQSATERMITRNANLTIVVTDPVQSVEEIGRMAREMDGYVVSSNQYVSTFGEAQTRAQYASITIRVPSDKLDEALAEIKADAVEVRNESVTGQDITQEYIDNESRLRNLEAAEEQLLEIMGSATDTEDVLNVFAQLTQIRGEIEVIRGRLQYLREAADTSSISIELIPDVVTQPIEVERWQLEGTFNKAVEALIATAQFFVRSLIVIVIYVLPVGLVIGLVVWLVVWIVRRRLRKGKAEAKKS